MTDHLYDAVAAANEAGATAQRGEPTPRQRALAQGWAYDDAAERVIAAEATNPSITRGTEEHIAFYKAGKAAAAASGLSTTPPDAAA